MRRGLLPLVLAVLAACGDAATVERLSAAETVDGIDVPMIGTVGDFPDPAHRHVVNVTAEGRIEVDGDDLSFGDLGASLKRWGALSDLRFDSSGWHVADAGAPAAVRFSGEHLVLPADRNLRWGVADRLVEAAIDERFLRIWFVVRHEGDGVEGALGYPATLSKWGIDMGGSIRVNSVETYGVDVVAGAGDGSPRRLFETLRALPPTRLRGFDVYLRVDLNLPTGAAFELVDAAQRAGTHALGMSWRRPAPKSDFDAVAKRASGSTYSFRLIDMPAVLDVQPVAMPPVSRVRGPAWTFTPWMYAPLWGDEKWEDVPPK